MNLLFAGVAVFLGTLALAVIYQRLWLSRKSADFVPTGFGFFFPCFLCGEAALTGAPPALTCSLGVIAAATGLYWLDDMSGLSASFRIAIQFLSGVVLCAVMLARAVDLPLLLGACMAAGLLNVVLTNVINFCDGADLNIAMLPFLTAVMMLSLGPDDAFRPLAMVTLCFVLGFAVVNSKPKALYFGDSGCFALACLLTAMAVWYTRAREDGQMYAAIPVALPLFDAFYVFVLRVRRGEDLLSRNYWHLYQRLQAKLRNFGYLLPQPLNSALVAGAAILLQQWSFSRALSVLIAMGAVTPVFYLLYRRYAVHGA
jgi:UDP-N-acetylmuramyl pentapeptide phosphotransferase/UDP-N-acetylglucosamine-1-phosphate transferase